MNFNTYGTYYGKFHRCTVSSVKQNVIIFDFGTSTYETWFITRMHPPENVLIDSDKPLLLALKAFFKSDVPASVVSNRKYSWTICLGRERVIYPVDKDFSKKENTLQFYATPYFVEEVDVVSKFLQGIIRPAYENVFFYKNTILFLDNQDLPYPGGFYFKQCEPSSYYRICFLSNEPTQYVLNLAAEWQSRQRVKDITYLTREVKAVPKFIDFKPISESGSTESNITSTGIIHKTLCARKPELLIQDILTSYYKNLSRQQYETPIEFNHLGLLIEWPFILSFEGSRPSDDKIENKKFVALSIEGAHPSRVLHVNRPYERYVEHSNIPATLWTPISFVLSTLLTDISIRKVIIDTVVVGVVYRETFFCFNQPLLEGTPSKHPLLNTYYILSTATFELNEDVNIRVFESFKLNNHYTLHRVSVKGLTQSVWCLTKSAETDPYPKKIHLTGLVKQWTDFFMEVGESTYNVDVTAVRLALMLSKHSLCFNLNAVEKPNEVIRVSDNEVNFYLNEKVVQFINDARLLKNEKLETTRQQACIIS